MGKTIRNSKEQPNKKKEETKSSPHKFKKLTKEEIEENRRSAYDYLF